MLSIGCNTDRESQMVLARKRLTMSFPGIRFTDAIMTAACGKPYDARPYSNMLAEGETVLSKSEFVAVLKQLEADMGDNAARRAQDIVMMDIDLLEYNGERFHPGDWQRPYIRKLCAMLAKLTLPLLLAFVVSNQCLSHTAVQQQSSTRVQDTELLGKALEYYQGGKYHECILTFEKLQRHYELSQRFLAYLGFSYYKEQKYEDAADKLQRAIPGLSAYSPRERSVYIYSCAESLFFLHRYKESLEFYDMALPLTEGNDKGDVLFHTAFARYLMLGHEPAGDDGNTMASCNDTLAIDTVCDLFSEALSLYGANTATATSLQYARRRQCERMLKGLRRKVEQ